ncbi:hypothetical protein PLESTF_000141200 [Pleodorina starrii]|nr:hypothetical protein PLESTF_000141200 [Pleodorina starrii]
MTGHVDSLPKDVPCLSFSFPGRVPPHRTRWSLLRQPRLCQHGSLPLGQAPTPPRALEPTAAAAAVSLHRSALRSASWSSDQQSEAHRRSCVRPQAPPHHHRPLNRQCSVHVLRSRSPTVSSAGKPPPAAVGHGPNPKPEVALRNPKTTGIGTSLRPPARQSGHPQLLRRCRAALTTSVKHTAAAPCAPAAADPSTAGAAGTIPPRAAPRSLLRRCYFHAPGATCCCCAACCRLPTPPPLSSPQFAYRCGGVGRGLKWRC